jgi:hypothetical protein
MIDVYKSSPVTKKRLLDSGSCGDLIFIQNFVNNNFTRGSTKITTVDEKGRNIMHLALLGKQQQYMRYLYDNRQNPEIDYEMLLTAVDCDGRNVLHQAVLMGDEEVLEICLIVPLTMSSSRTMIFNVDNKGRTAQDYAIMFKRPPKMLSILNSFTFSTSYCMYEDDFDALEVRNDDNIHELLVRYFSVQGSLDNVKLNQSLTKILDNLMINSIMQNHIKCVKFFVETTGWNIPRRIFSGDSSLYIMSGLNMCLKNIWPERFYSPTKRETPLHFDDLMALHDQLYILCDEWDCKTQSFEQFLVSKQPVAATKFSLTPFHYNVPDVTSHKMLKLMLPEKANAFYQEWLQELVDVIQVPKRLAVFEYLCDKSDQRLILQTAPILECITHSGLLATLQWYVDRYWINLQSPLESDLVQWKSAQTISWMIDSTTGEIQRGLSLCEFLCGVSLMAFQVWY